MIVSRHHNGSPHLRRQIREIHSLRTGRFHGAPGRATNLPCPITPHHETVTRLFREKPATGQPPSRNSRLHESHFTNPPPRKTARPNHQQARPVHQHDPAAKNCPPAKDRQPAKELPASQRTISRPKNHQPAKKLPTRPNRQQHDQTACNQTKLQPAREPSTSQRTARRPKNHPPASRLISGPCRR